MDTPAIQSVKDRDQLQAVLNTVMNLLLPQEARYFRTSLPVVSFSGRRIELNWKRLEPYRTSRRSQSNRCFCMLPYRTPRHTASARCLFAVTRA